MWTYFEDIGNLGVVRDAPPELLAPGVWTDARNMRFQDNKIKRMAGTRNVFNNAANVEPYWLVSVVGPEGAIAWAEPQTFVPGTTEYLDWAVGGSCWRCDFSRGDGCPGKLRLMRWIFI